MFCLVLLSKKAGFWAIFKALSAGNWLFWLLFHTSQAAWKAYLTSFTSPTTTTWPGTPPTNSWRNKQFLLSSRSLALSM
jgi:hypothetical protein